jgi:PAS domain S-box-containing protein
MRHKGPEVWYGRLHRQRILIHHSNVPTIVTAEDGRTIDVNDAFCALVGRRFADVITVPIETFFATTEPGHESGPAPETWPARAGLQVTVRIAYGRTQPMRTVLSRGPDKGVVVQFFPVAAHGPDDVVDLDAGSRLAVG